MHHENAADITAMTFREFALHFHGGEPVVEDGKDHFGMRDSCHGREVARTRETVRGAIAYFTVVDDGDVGAFKRSLRESLATPFSRRLATHASRSLGLHVDANVPDAVVDRVVERFVALPRDDEPATVPLATRRGMADLLACHRRAVDRAIAAGREVDPRVRNERESGREDAWLLTVPARGTFLFREDILPVREKAEADDPCVPRT